LNAFTAKHLNLSYLHTLIGFLENPSKKEKRILKIVRDKVFQSKQYSDLLGQEIPKFNMRYICQEYSLVCLELNESVIGRKVIEGKGIQRVRAQVDHILYIMRQASIYYPYIRNELEIYSMFHRVNRFKRVLDH
jgi:hypothetical protein